MMHRGGMSLWINHQKIKFLMVIGGVMSLASILAVPVSAHEVQINNGIAVELHIDPNDHPVAKEKSNFLLAFHDASSSFSLNNYQCDIVITKNGQEVSRFAAKETSPTSSMNSYTFLEGGTYRIKVVGVPIAGSKLSSFTVSYTVPVLDPVGSSAIPLSDWIIGGGAIILLLVTSLVLEYLRRR